VVTDSIAPFPDKCRVYLYGEDGYLRVSGGVGDREIGPRANACEVVASARRCAEAQRPAENRSAMWRPLLAEDAPLPQ
jgi:hypothetical protein